MALPMVDAVIVGAGAGGPVVAQELVRAGWRVVLLERGKWNTAWDCLKDDLHNQRNPNLGNPFGPEDEGNPRVVVGMDGKAVVTAPYEGGYSNNAACVGGGTLSYGAMAWRFQPADFQMATKYGVPPGSTLADWPITYDELEPYYEKAEWEMGVSGDVSNDPFKGPRKKPLPMPPVTPEGREFAILDKAARKLGWHPFHIPMLRNSIPYNGRPACMRCRWCVGFACEVDAKNGTQNTVLPVALKTGLLELRTECMAKEIVVDQHGRASGVRYFDREGHSWEQPARVVVCSGGAIESARLLLNSATPAFPRGLGNRYDWVGRNLQGHTYTGAWGMFDEIVYDDIGPGATVAISDFNHGNPGMCGGGALCNEFIRLPTQFLGARPPGVPRWGQGYKDWVRQAYRRTITIMGPTQEMPVFDSRIQLDPQVRDKFGIPVARISGPKHPHTLEISAIQAKHAEDWLKEAGAVKTWLRLSGQGTSGGQHQAGTCRMGNDPKTSVVDRDCRVHDLQNVYVVDASVNVTNGGFNPVLTILANAFRVGEKIAKAQAKARG
jgi:choline dehydrogenase-like flavoprotein